MCFDSFNVNYTPEGSYMTYEDGGSMVGYDLNLTFKEIEPVFNMITSVHLHKDNMGLLITMDKSSFRNIPDFNYVSRLDGQKEYQ